MATTAPRPMSAEEKKVIFASSLGTVFEWYDFYLYGSLAAIIAKQFFSGLDEGSAFIFALLAFAAGFIVRPFGALVFGRLGDMIGRKYTFLVTILIMGLSTFIVGVLPNYATIGVAAPVILIALRMLQGLALGGEYGGAATYVAEHAPQGRRGAYTSWIQTTATLGLFLSLMVILGTRTAIGEAAFADWGWRVPFIVSILLSMEKPEDCDFGVGRFDRRPGCGVVLGPVLRLVLPDPGAQGGRCHCQHHGGDFSDHWHTVLHCVWCLVRQDWPQAHHHGGLPAGGGDVLPRVHGADQSGQPRPGPRAQSSSPARATLPSNAWPVRR